MTCSLGSTASVDELHRRLEIVYAASKKHLIGIDGVDGSGKTTLAKRLAKRFGGSVVSLDDYLDKNQNAYTLHVRCHELNRAIANSQSPILIEGVCLLAVARRCGFSVDVHVYVRRLSKNSLLWHDEEMCMAETEADELKRVERELQAAAAKLGDEDDPISDQNGLGLRGELIDYHAGWKPVQLADLVFDIVHE